jgi:hypothetical protein
MSENPAPAADTEAPSRNVMCAGLVAPPLLDIGPPKLDGSIDVRAVTQHTAERWFGQYHYSGTIGPSPGARFFGIFRPDLAAVVAVGMGANETGVARKFDLQRWPGNWEITRVAVHPDAPKNTATAAIAAVLRILAGAGVRWVFSYADTAQGHHGGIYQGLNAVYVGASPGEAGYLLDGVPVHPRSLVSRFGTRGEAVYEMAAKCGQTLVKVPHLNAPKHTYVLPCGPLPVVRQIRKHLRPYQRPYPKRAEEVSRVTRPDSIGEGGVRLPGSALSPADEKGR